MHKIYCILREATQQIQQNGFVTKNMNKTYQEANCWTWKYHRIQRSKWCWRLWWHWAPVFQWHCMGWGWTQTPIWHSTPQTCCWGFQRFWAWGTLREKSMLSPSPSTRRNQWTLLLLCWACWSQLKQERFGYHSVRPQQGLQTPKLMDKAKDSPTGHSPWGVFSAHASNQLLVKETCSTLCGWAVASKERQFSFQKNFLPSRPTVCWAIQHCHPAWKIPSDHPSLIPAIPFPDPHDNLIPLHQWEQKSTIIITAGLLRQQGDF